MLKLRTWRRGRMMVGALALSALSACGGSPTSPTPTLTTDTFTGTVKVGGSDSKTFTVNYGLSASDASVTVTSLTLASTQAALATTIGVGFGTLAFDGSCARASTYTDAAAAIGSERVATGAFVAGTYCIQVFDAGTLTGDTTYAISVKHY